MNRVVELIRRGRQPLVDRFVARLLETIPQYTRFSGPELREGLDAFVGDLLTIIEVNERRPFSERLVEVAQRRIAQGFSPADFLRATLTALPLLREHVRATGPRDDPSFAREYAEVEALLNDAAVNAANVFVDAITAQLEQKNHELNRVNQQLKAQEKLLSREIGETVAALQSATELNRRVIDSLSAGVLALDAATTRVTLYSRRAEEILGIPTEAVLDRTVDEALSGIEGLPLPQLISTVRRSGHVPLTRLLLRLPGGRRRAVYLRAERLYNPGGEPDGTVAVFDDVTERELLIDSFSRYVSRDVLQRLLARGELRLDGERRRCTVLFADIRGFSGIAETLAPEALHELINAYFRVMITAVAEHGGFIDKFVGDKVMALFTAADDPSLDARAAAQAAQQIQRSIHELNEHRKARQQIPIEVGIGINTGEVLLGNVGSEERMNFTAIGDVVNIADRLQSIARASEILAGEETARLLGSSAALTPRGPTPIKGRANPVLVFELGGD